jgi:ABC-type Mn2+/Zn2+ transport system ATPase subunit
MTIDPSQEQEKPLIEFSRVTVGYGRNAVIRDVSFTVTEGDFFGMVGPNGAGKTTILRTILGILPPMSGTIVQQRPGGGTLRFGYVPQRDSIDLILPYTVREVVMMGRYRRIGLIRGLGNADRTIVERSLAHAGILELQDHRFRDLSGGQKQRTLIARALASEPDVLILDEPTNGMDLSSRLAILELASTLRREDRLTVIMVSHLLDDVANHARTIALVEREFVVVGRREEVLTSELLSSLYRLPIKVMHEDGTTSILPGRTHDTR